MPDQDQFIKFGGMKFEKNASPKEINNFVKDLDTEKKDSLFEVSQALDEAGLITMLNQMTTIDDEMLEAQQTNE